MTANVMEWTVSASALIVVVLLLRWLLGKRISAGLRYGLWAVVLMRLLVPVSLSLAVTVPQLPKWDPPEAMQEDTIYVLPVSSLPLEDSGVHVAEDGTLGDPNSFGYPRLTSDGERVVRYAEKISPLELLKWVWIVGAAVMGCVLIVSNLRFSRRLWRVRRPLEGTAAPIPVYVASALPSPCLVGLLFPAIYVTEEAAADPAMLRHVLAHELTHYSHRDHLWSVLRGAALAVHWWNPLVWLAVVCSRRDGELACDEGALKRLGDGERAAYGETLLSLVTAKARPADLLSFATTMSGGKKSLRERIQRIAHRPKQLVSAMIVVMVVLSLSVLVAFGQAKEAETPDIPISQEPPDATTNRPADAWKTAQITVDENGIPHIDYAYGNTMEFLDGSPIPAPREWADDDLAGRNEATALQYSPDIWAKLVSPTDGWLVACYGRGVAAADTYVYKTEDGGMNWTEVTMPGTSWHIADVGFLSPDRLIVAQQLFDGAPCFITKDGGESWEEIELPDAQVLSIGNIADTVYMDIGKHEGDPATFSMISSDMGDHWSVGSAGLRRFILSDLDHDGLPDMLDLWHTVDESIETWKLQFTSSYMSSPAWEGEALSPHVGWTAFFLCRMEGEDYLLQYTPYMGGGVCRYSYKLFYLTASGGEVVVQENAVDFDLIFDPEYAEQHQYDPWAINAFMEEINALLADSEQLMNTDENLLGTFQTEGRLYDSLWWLDKAQDENLSLLDNLLNYGSYAQDHPDDVWSPLADLLLGLTEEDIAERDADVSILVQYLKAAERGSRFYTWDSYAEAYDGHGAEAYSAAQRDIALADGSTLHLIASSQNDGDTVLIILETLEEMVSAFYKAPGLNSAIAERAAIPAMQEALATLQPEDIHCHYWNINIDHNALIDALQSSARQLTYSGGEGGAPQYLIYFTSPNTPTRPVDVAELAAMDTEGLVRITCQCTTTTAQQMTGYVEDAELYQLVCSHGLSVEDFPWDVYRAKGFTLMVPSPEKFHVATFETGVWQILSEDDPRAEIEIYFSSLPPQQIYEDPELLFEGAKDIENKDMGQGSGFDYAFYFTGKASEYSYLQNVYLAERGSGSLIYVERLPDDADRDVKELIARTGWMFHKLNISEHE